MELRSNGKLLLFPTRCMVLRTFCTEFKMHFLSLLLSALLLVAAAGKGGIWFRSLLAFAVAVSGNKEVLPTSKELPTMEQMPPAKSRRREGFRPS